MENKLITTFKEYKETYQTLLENHLAEYADYDELHFIESELTYYDTCLQTATVTEYKIPIFSDYHITDFDYKYLNKIEAEEKTENSKTTCITENYDVAKLTKIDGSISTDGYNLKKCEQLKISFNKIIEFLREKEIIINKTNEYQSNFNQPDTTILSILDGIEIPKEDSKKIQQSKKYLYLKETAKEYIEKHDKRLKEFLNDFEADEIDYVNKEKEYFENTLYDVQNSESSHDGYSVTGYDNFSTAYELVCNIGFDKFMYSTNAKLKFLESKIIVDLPYQNVSNNENPISTYTLNWIGEQTAFIELAKALIENGNIKVNKGEQVKTINTLSKFFNIKINYPNKLISDIKTRNNGSETLFLDELKKTLLDYITTEKTKNTRK